MCPGQNVWIVIVYKQGENEKKNIKKTNNKKTHQKTKQNKQKQERSIQTSNCYQSIVVISRSVSNGIILNNIYWYQYQNNAKDEVPWFIDLQNNNFNK